MPQLVLPQSIDSGTQITATEHQQNYTAIATHVNQELINRDGSVSFTNRVSGVDPTSPANLATKSYVDTKVADVGDIKLTARPEAPAGWLFCAGQTASRTAYAALFAAIGTAFGAGDGSTTFNLPDLRGKSPVAPGGALALALGGAGGSAAPKLLSHSHTINHDHPAATTSSDGVHDHGQVDARPMITFAGAGNLATGTGYGTTPDAWETEGAHTHTVDVPNFAGSSGTATSGDDTTGNYHPVQAINFVIYAGV